MATTTAPARPGPRKQYPNIFATVNFLTRPESQTFAFAVATMAVLSFFPFMIVLIMIIRQLLESAAMYDVLLRILRDHLPIAQDFVVNALAGLVAAHKHIEFFSIVVLFIASRAVFMPLEVALNRIWGFEKSRNWINNQVVGIGLALLCGVIGLASVALTAGNQFLFLEVLGGGQHRLARLGTFIIMKLISTAASVGIFFFIYWLIPNGKVSASHVFPAALWFGILWEALKYFYVLALPHINFQLVYGPFAVSVALIFWGYLSGLVLLAGAYASATRHG
jgi:membrane protein